MSHVIKNKLKNIVEKHKALKRGSAYFCVDLEEYLKIEEMGEKIKTNDNQDLKIDISEAVSKLSSKQRLLCKLLREKGLSINEASKEMGIPNSTAHEEIKRIRKIFESYGLRDYLK